ncbi:MAG: hypothetical protein JW839_05995 [Candidatus Lokiarchaeota archaeon]|nr:hypothetical protein [Candidatus Lokiarchaeota archaeon]
MRKDYGRVAPVIANVLACAALAVAVLPGDGLISSRTRAGLADGGDGHAVVELHRNVTASRSARACWKVTRAERL